MNTLPNEIFTMILKYLPVKQLRKIRLVNRKVYDCGLQIIRDNKREQCLKIGDVFKYKTHNFTCRMRVTNAQLKQDWIEVEIIEGNDVGKKLKKKLFKRPSGGPYIKHNCTGSQNKLDLVVD